MIDPYEARFTFFWYNDQEIFHDTEEELEGKIARLADRGITHIITFSCTHFRWSYRSWWKEINACLARIVKAAHKHGLKVIEHHSSELSYLTDTPAHLDRLKRYLRDHGSSLDSWPGIADQLNAPGSPSLIWTQINAATGSMHVTGYAASSKCYNNPDYRREYLKYLEGVYATGVDGIMTDDVQYYCSCRCEHCRRLFKEKYGYELPSPEDWDKWYGNMRDPSFIAWLKFRFDSTHSFHELVAEHYHSLGLKLLRPNYQSLAVTRDWTAMSVETVPELHWFFQECARSCVIRYSWPKVLSEQSHRSMVARARQIPHGILFYAYDRDQLVFSWGLSMLCGAFYINTPEGLGGDVDESPIRQFEKAHAQELFHAGPMPQIGFLDSRSNRYFSPGYEMSRMEFWLQTCLIYNLPCVMLDVENPEFWKGCPVICVNEVNILSSRQIADLRKFAEDGGILVLTGIPGNQDGDCRERSRKECEDLWGISFQLAPGEKTRVFPAGKGKICIASADFGYPGPAEDIRKIFGTDHMDFRFGELPFELLKSLGFICANTIRTENRPYPSRVQELYAGFRNQGRELADWLRSLSSDVKFETDLPDLVMAVPFQSSNSRTLSVRILNASGTLTPPGDGSCVSHEDPIPWLNQNQLQGSFTIALPAGMEDAGHARCHTLDHGESELECIRSGSRLKVLLPPGTVQDFALIVIS